MQRFHGIRRYPRLIGDCSRWIKTSAKVPKLVEIRDRLRSLGASTTGTKSELMQRYRNLLQQPLPHPSHPILSIDVGYRNLAYCILGSNTTILHWKRIALIPTDVSSYSPQLYVDGIHTFIQELRQIGCLREWTCLVEQQRHQSVGRVGIPEAIFRVNVVQVLLHAMLPMALGIHVYAVSPKRVSMLFAHDGQDKKKASVATVLTLLPSLNMKDELRNGFMKMAKKDDMADALLQGMAWKTWLEQRQLDIQNPLYKCVLEMGSCDMIS